MDFPHVLEPCPLRSRTLCGLFCQGESTPWARQVPNKWQELGDDALERWPCTGWLESGLLFEWRGKEAPGFPGPGNLLMLLKSMAQKPTTLGHFVHSLRS